MAMMQGERRIARKARPRRRSCIVRSSSAGAEGTLGEVTVLGWARLRGLAVARAKGDDVP
jgi:hypothetical protein